MATPFRVLVDLCEKLEATRKRLEMTSLAADFLRNLEPEEVESAVSMLLGRPFLKTSQRTLEVSWNTLSKIIMRMSKADWSIFEGALAETGDVGSAAKALLEKSRVKRQVLLVERSLTILQVRRGFEDIAETVGRGSRERKARLIESLMSSASSLEAKYLVKILTGDMRTGLSEGLMEQTVAKAFGIPLEKVQTASMTVGDIGEIAAIAKIEGREGLSKVSFRVFRPVNLMLAQVVDDVASALEKHGGSTAFEYKYDGARVQVHKCDDEVRVFSRRLTDVTESLPEIVQLVRKNVAAREAILEGEVIAVDSSGHPIPFQHLMRRFRRIHEVKDTAKKIPIEMYLFDILYLNGKSVISMPYVERRQLLSENSGCIQLTEQIVTDKTEEAERFLGDALEAGQEGLMAKRLASQYMPGFRGKHWLKIKPVLESLDLVVVAAEYGYGRRHGWLSDYYLAARDTETNKFHVVGKTFKGLTDAEITEMTRKLKEMTTKDERWRVSVIPKIVVEVAYNEIQKSPKYDCGMALRFARITRIRDDKTPEEADTIQKVREIYERQFSKKSKYKAD